MVIGQRAPSAATSNSYVALIAIASGLTYGYDGTSMAGVQLFLTSELGLSTAAQGSLFASPAVGLIVGVLCARRLADVLGRRVALMLLAAGYTVTAVASPMVANLVWLDATRFLLGTAMGLAIVITPIFIAESVSATHRGRVAVLYQVATAAGCSIAYFTAYALAGGGHWRLMLGASAILSAATLALLIPARETARWRAMRDQRDQPGGRSRGAIRELSSSRYRALTLFVLLLGFLVQITGVTAIGYFSPRIFQRMGFQGYPGLLALPGVIELAGLLAALAATFTVDRLGRRATLLTGIAVMAAGHAILVTVFAASRFSTTTTVLGFLGLLVFIVGFNGGFGSLVWVYVSEGYPDRLRAAGASTMLLSNLVANLLIAQFFLGVLTSLGGAATFALLLSVTMAAWVFVFRYAPETKNRTLDEIHTYWQNDRQWPATPQPTAVAHDANAGT